MTLGEKIKDLRKKANISQEELAEKLGISRQAVSKWEGDIGLPDVDNLKQIATLFNISIDDLLDYKKDLLGEIVLEEEYSLEGIKKTGRARNKEEAYLLNKYIKADNIYALQKRKNGIGKRIYFGSL